MDNCSAPSTSCAGDPSEQTGTQSASVSNSEPVLLGDRFQSLYEFKDGQFVPAHVPTILTNGRPTFSAASHSEFQLGSQKVVPIAWAIVPTNDNLAMATNVSVSERGLTVDDPTPTVPEYGYDSSDQLDKGYIESVTTSLVPEHVDSSPPLDISLNVLDDSEFDMDITHLMQPSVAPIPPPLVSQSPYLWEGNTSASASTTIGCSSGRSNALGQDLSTTTFQATRDGSDGWPEESLAAIAPYEAEYILAPQPEYDPTVTVSDEGTTFESAVSEHPWPMPNAFLPVEPPILEGTGMTSTSVPVLDVTLSQQQKPVAPSFSTDSKVVKTKKASRCSSIRQKDLGIMYQDITHRHVQAESGESQGIMSVFGAKQRVRPKLGLQAKLEIAEAKLRGVCPRCQRLKKKCRFGQSPYQPCISCLLAKPSILKTPCTLRATIADIFLFRRGPSPDVPNHPLDFSKHRKDVLALSDTETQHLPQSKTVELTQDMGLALKILVSPYVPIAHDKTAYEWSTTDGPRSMEMPPYCIENIKEAKKSILAYAHTARLPYLENLLDSSNSILWDTFHVALRSKKPMVQTAISIWSTNRFIERTWRICGAETLGMEAVTDKTNPWNGIIPVTPIMDQQLDQIVIREILVPWRDALLRQLNQKISDYEKRRENWSEIYLTMFILLSNTEVQLAHNLQFARRYGFSGRYGPYGKYSDAEAQFHAAMTILAHFHHVCRGSTPLSIDANSRQSLKSALLDDDTIAYVLTVQEQIKKKEKYWQSLRTKNQYETDLYWCHQLFFGGWDSGSGHIEELTE